MYLYFEALYSTRIVGESYNLYILYFTRFACSANIYTCYVKTHIQNWYEIVLIKSTRIVSVQASIKSFSSGFFFKGIQFTYIPKMVYCHLVQ